MKKLSIVEAKELFLESNYILLDSIFWTDLFENLNEYKIDYISIGIEYFGHKELSPLLIDLKYVKNKIEFWDRFGEFFYLNATSEFDHMSIFQNFIKTEANIWQIKEYIQKNMVVNVKGKNKIFRFYDSRVMMYLPYILNSNSEDFNKIKINFFDLKLDSWVVNVSGGYYSILEDLEFFENQNNYDVLFFSDLTKVLREKYKIHSDFDLNDSIEKEIKVLTNG